jgi:hypothetical protein
MNSISVDDLFSTEAAANYLGCTVLNVKKHLTGILMHPRLRVYHRAELDHYKAQMMNARKKGREPYPDIEALARQVHAAFINVNEAATLLELDVKRVYEQLEDKMVEFAPARRKVLRRTDVEAIIKSRPA